MLDVIIRQTLGWRKESDRITLDQFAEKTGMDKPHTIRAIEKLEGMGIIRVEGMPVGSLPKKAMQAHNYSVNLGIDKWKPSKEALPKRNVAKSGNDYCQKWQRFIAKSGNGKPGRPKRHKVSPRPK